MVILRYIGTVNELGDPSFLMGVPARDLSEEDVESRGLDVEVLIDSGLYEAVYSTSEADVATLETVEGGEEAAEEEVWQQD